MTAYSVPWTKIFDFWSHKNTPKPTSAEDPPRWGSLPRCQVSLADREGGTLLRSQQPPPRFRTFGPRASVFASKRHFNYQAQSVGSRRSARRVTEANENTGTVHSSAKERFSSVVIRIRICIRIRIRIATKIQSFVRWTIANLRWKFHANLFGSFWRKVVNRQTDKQRRKRNLHGGGDCAPPATVGRNLFDRIVGYTRRLHERRWRYFAAIFQVSVTPPLVCMHATTPANQRRFISDVVLWRQYSFDL